MSITVSVLESRIRRMLGDEDAGRPYVIPTDLLRQTIDDVSQMLCGTPGLGLFAWQAGAVALVAGTTDYTIAGLEVRSIEAVRASLDGRYLDVVPQKAIDDRRDGQATISRSRPHLIAFWEDISNVTNARVHPAPAESETLDVFRSIVPATLATDAVTASVSRLLTVAFTRMVCVGLYTRTPERGRMVLNVSPEVVKLWGEEAAKVVEDERIRLSRLRRPSSVARVYV